MCGNANPNMAAHLEHQVAGPVRSRHRRHGGRQHRDRTAARSLADELKARVRDVRVEVGAGVADGLFAREQVGVAHL